MDEIVAHIDGQDEEWLPVNPDLVVARRPAALNSRLARTWSLVLDSRGVPCCLNQNGEYFELLVPGGRLQQAYHELRRFETHNQGWPPAQPPSRLVKENLLATLSVLILLATFHNITQMDIYAPGVSMPDWVALGGAQATNILSGQWWRLVTALTLHADWAHLSSNLAIGGIFIALLCRELGSGLAWSLLLGAGTLGNLINACLQPANHNSVGASTAVFGAVGILAAISMVRYRQNLRKRWALPVAAAVALLALLGTEGKNTDLGAHLFGFVAGGGLGLITEHLIGGHGLPGRRLNVLLALLSSVVVVAAWLLAITF